MTGPPRTPGLQVAVLLCAAAGSACVSDVSFVSGPVTVEVYEANGLPAEGAPVVFHDARGRLLGSELTDVNGLAIWDAAGPLTVTVVRADFDSTALQTLVDVGPNESVRFGMPVEPTERIGEVVLALPPRPHFGWFYVVDTPCMREGLPVSSIPHQEYRIDVDGDCVRADGTISALVEAYSLDNDLDGRPDYLTATHVTDLPVARDGRTIVQMPMWDPELEQRDVALVDAPEGMLVEMEFRYLLADESVFYGDEAGGVEAKESIGSYAHTFTRPAAHAEGLGMAMIIYWPLNEEDLGYESLYVHRTRDLDEATTASFSQLPPRFAETSFTDAWPPRFAWRNGDGMRPTANRLRLLWSDNRDVQWDIVMNPGRGILTLPELPANLQFLGPNASVPFESRLLGSLETDTLASWQDYFQYAPLFTLTKDGARNRIMPPEYTVRITQVELH